jgi:hypothetical protein
MPRAGRYRIPDGPRREPDWYDQSDEPAQLAPGDLLFVACEGGPSSTRLESYPPRLEIEERTGTYVLMDEGRRDDWRYVFVPRGL